jgi:hypothetical protein
VISEIGKNSYHSNSGDSCDYGLLIHCHNILQKIKRSDGPIAG